MYSNYGILKLSTQSKVFVIYQKKVVKSCTINKNLHVSQKKKSTLFNKIKNKNLYLSQKKKNGTLYIYMKIICFKRKITFYKQNTSIKKN